MDTRFQRLSAWLLAALVGVSPAGCGFHLREAKPLPFGSVRVAISDVSELGAALKRNIRASGSTRLAGPEEDTEAVFVVTHDLRERIILSLSATGRVREIQLRMMFGFRIEDPKGRQLMPAQLIQVKRDLSYSDADVLAKEQEEALLFRDMQNDIVQQIMRRLSATRPAAADLEAVGLPAAPAPGPTLPFR